MQPGVMELQLLRRCICFRSSAIRSDSPSIASLATDSARGPRFFRGIRLSAIASRRFSSFSISAATFPDVHAVRMASAAFRYGSAFAKASDRRNRCADRRSGGFPPDVLLAILVKRNVSVL